MATVKKSVVLANKYGLHMRPAHRFMDLANQFSCRVSVSLDGRTVNGKSILDLTTLGAQCGVTLDIECAGADADACMEALTRFVESMAEVYNEQ